MATPTVRPELDAGTFDRLASLGLRLSDWFERWFPDAFALALAATAIVVVGQRPGRAAPLLDTAQRFGAGLLGPGHVHDADVDDRRHRLRRGHGAARLRGRARGWRPCRRPGPGAVAYVGLFSMLASLLSWSFSLIFSGAAGARGGAPGEGRGLPRDRRRGLPRRRQRVGARPVVVGRAHHGVAGVAARLGRGASAASSRSARRSGCGRAWSSRRALIVVSMAISYLLRAAGVAGQEHGRHGRHLRSRRRTTSATRHDARRVAGVQPVPDDRHLRCSASAIWRARSSPTAAGRPAAAQPLHLHVPDRGPAAALAAQDRSCRRSAPPSRRSAAC